MANVQKSDTNDLPTTASPVERMFRSFPALPFQVEGDHDRIHDGDHRPAPVDPDAVLTMVAAMRASRTFHH